MIGLGVWEIPVNSMFYKGSAEITVLDNGGEYDMVVFDSKSNTCRIFEVKHSDKIVDRQAKHLRDESKTSLVEHRFGKILAKYVIYRGTTQDVDGIQYVNAEEYLKNIWLTNTIK